jgi:broad specificity phosphatase PhoE
MKRRVILVRHGEVAPRWRGVCYGQTDVELSDHGQRQTSQLIEELATWPIHALWHSGLTRARCLAEPLAALLGLPCREDSRLAEIHFGAWEGRDWQAIFAETGRAMEAILSAPDHFAPPGGETLHGLRDRVLSWFHELPAEGLLVAICHGGPIAALRGTLAGLPASHWPTLVPQMGTWVELPS